MKIQYNILYFRTFCSTLKMYSDFLSDNKFTEIGLFVPDIFALDSYDIYIYQYMSYIGKERCEYN